MYSRLGNKSLPVPPKAKSFTEYYRKSIGKVGENCTWYDPDERKKKTGKITDVDGNRVEIEGEDGFPYMLNSSDPAYKFSTSSSTSPPKPSLTQSQSSSSGGTCKQGERADLTGCTPASGEGKLTGGALPNLPAKVEPTKPKPVEKKPETKPVSSDSKETNQEVTIKPAPKGSKSPLPKPSKEWQNEAMKNGRELLIEQGRSDLAKKPFKMELVSIADITPSQTGEDYLNDSSRYLAQEMKRVQHWGMSKIERDDDFFPIVLDEKGKIIDGNHRHAAHTINKYKYIWAMVPKV